MINAKHTESWTAPGNSRFPWNKASENGYEGVGKKWLWHKSRWYTLNIALLSEGSTHHPGKAVLFIVDCPYCFSLCVCRSAGWEARDHPGHMEADPQGAHTHHPDIPECLHSGGLWDHWCRILYLHGSESPRTDYSSHHCWVFLTWKNEAEWTAGKPVSAHNQLWGAFDLCSARGWWKEPKPILCLLRQTQISAEKEILWSKNRSVNSPNRKHVLLLLTFHVCASSFHTKACV